MKIWKIVTVLLAVLLLAGCVSGADIIISVATPETGDKPGTPTTTTSGITLGTTTWSPIVSDTFNAGTPYKMTVEAKKSTEFAQGTTATVNGKEAIVTLTNNNKTALISYIFSTNTAELMSSITVTGITAPVTAAYPDTKASVTTDEGLNSAEIEKITWSLKDSSYFLMDKNYTVTVVIKPASKEYAWDSVLTASIDGKPLTSSQISQKDGKVTLTYTYPKTTLLGRIPSMKLEVSKPVIGNSPSSEVTSKTTGVSGKAVWTPSGKFQPDIPYTVTISVETSYGYLFDSSISATVNNVTADDVQRESDTKATVIYTFPLIASVNTVNVNFEAPATGEIAKTTATSVTAAPSGAAKSATIKWTPALVDGEFDAGIEYMAEVTIPISGSNTVFDKETIVYINGEKAEIASVSSNSIKATYTFPKTLFIPNPIEIIKEMFNLMLAIFNPASYVFL